MTMATGIVGIAAWQLGQALLAQALLVMNTALYGLLWLFYLARLARYPRRFAADLADHWRGPGFFTAVAASGVLGSQFLLLADGRAVASVLWFVALGLWLLLTYGIFTALTIKQDKPGLEDGINGGWLLAVVATQSIAVLGALLASQTSAVSAHRLGLNFLALSMWLCGGMLYVWLAVLIFYRWIFFRVRAEELTPPYWINMGAMAISTLAGALLATNATTAPFLHRLQPLIESLTVLCWAIGTWWIPLLVVLSLWRHVRMRVPLHYDPLYWGAVFPLGMYAACTFEMARTLDLGFLGWIPGVFFVAALLAWSASFLGMLGEMLNCLIRRVPAQSQAGQTTGRPDI